ncbi:MAG: AMP-binding protein [Gemmatales bacterium]|nr:AMP-binding protein [Gemmatales bacterium]MDW7994787.1 AMP-binding protein [Gemmatales bacterium]
MARLGERDLQTDREALRAWQLERLRAMLTEILLRNRFYQRKLGQFPLPRSLDEMSAWPFTTKDELLADQRQHPPYGSNLTYPVARYVRVHQTSGSTAQPLRWPDTPENWEWLMQCWRWIFQVVGLRAGDRLFFPFSFGPFLGFWAAWDAAVRGGWFVLPGGGMTSVARLRAILEHRITVIFCTPTYALHLLEVARREGLTLQDSAVRLLIVAGEPGGSVPHVRQRIEQGWQARVFDHTGMTEIGSLGIECPENPGGVHLLETECIAEVIDPSTSKPVPAGVEGELVLTNLGRWGSPLIRYRTGDRVLVDPQPCPCGRIWLRLQGGILGRFDDLVVVRGVKIYPSALDEVLHRFPELVEYRVTWRSDQVTESFLIEVEPSTHELADGPAAMQWAERIAQEVKSVFLVNPTVLVVAPGSLPRYELKARRWRKET